MTQRLLYHDGYMDRGILLRGMAAAIMSGIAAARIRMLSASRVLHSTTSIIYGGRTTPARVIYVQSRGPRAGGRMGGSIGAWFVCGEDDLGAHTLHTHTHTDTHNTDTDTHKIVSLAILRRT